MSAWSALAGRENAAAKPAVKAVKFEGDQGPTWSGIGQRVVRIDPALAGQGAVLLLEKLSPAVNQIDSSSGALGNATNGVVEKMVPLIAATSVPRRVRERWLRLSDAAGKA